MYVGVGKSGWYGRCTFTFPRSCQPFAKWPWPCAARVRLSASSPARRAVSFFLPPSPYGRLTVVPASVFLCVIPISALLTCLNLWLLSKNEVVFLIIGCCDFLWGAGYRVFIGFMIRAYLLPVCIARLFSSLSCVFWRAKFSNLTKSNLPNFFSHGSGYWCYG